MAKKGKKVLLISCILLAALAAASFGIYCIKALQIKKLGITVRPSSIYEPRDIKVFLQNDPAWKDDTLGNSQFRLGGHGCLVSVLASVMNDLGHETDVKELNQLFTGKGVYNSEGEVIWYKIGEAVPGVTYQYKRVFNGRTLQSDLLQGRLPVVMVRYHKTGVFHWVLIVGSDGEDFLIIDPLKSDKKVAKLGIHGKVYAYRVIK